jgi:hypothetical protein
MWETLLPILIKYVLIPEIARIVKADPSLDDAGILAKLPADIQVLTTSNQSFLDAIRSQAGRS